MSDDFVSLPDDLMAAMSASSDGGKAIVPYPSAMRLSGSNTVHSLTLYLKDSSLSSETVDNVKQLLDSAFNYRDSAYSIINLDSLLDTMNSITGIITSAMTRSGITLSMAFSASSPLAAPTTEKPFNPRNALIIRCSGASSSTTRIVNMAETSLC